MQAGGAILQAIPCTPTKWDVSLLMECGERLKTTHALLGFVTYT